MKKRLFSLAIVITMVLSVISATLVINAEAAETVLTVQLPETLPKKDDVFEVTVTITDNPGIAALQFTLAYERDQMECLSAAVGTALKGASISVANPDPEDGAIIAVASLSELKKDGEIAFFRFRAKEDMSNYSFSLKDITLSRIDDSDIEYSLKENSIVSAVAPDPDAKHEQSVSTIDDTVVENETDISLETPIGAPGETHTETSTETSQEATTISFTDTVGHWAEEFIVKGVENKLFNGVGDGKFAPNASITRADFVTILWRAYGSPEPSKLSNFEDVPADSYYAKPVAWAKEKGYISGYSDSLFGSKDNIQRQAVMKILYATSGGISGMEMIFRSVYDSEFKDSDNIASWAKPGMYWAYYNGIISGSDGNLFPENGTTRAEMAKIIVNYLEKFQNKEAIS